MSEGTTCRREGRLPTGALSARLFYRVLHRITGWRPVALAGTFLDAAGRGAEARR